MTEKEFNLSDKIYKGDNDFDGKLLNVKDVREFIRQNILDLNELMEHTCIVPGDCGCYICHHQEEFRNVFEELKKKQIKRAGEKLI